MYPEITQTLQKLFAKYPTTTATEDLYTNLTTDLNKDVQERIAQGETKQTAINAVLDNLNGLDDLLATLTASSPRLPFDNRQLNKLYDRFFATELVNSLTFSITHLSQLIINYRLAKIVILPAEGDQIIVNEYYNHDRPKLYAQAKRNGDQLKIDQPSRVTTTLIRIRVEVMVPKQFTGFVYINNKSGDVHLTDLKANYIMEVNTTSGDIYGQKIDLAQINLQAKSGNIKATQLKSPQISLQNTSGSIELTAAIGVGPEGMINGRVKSGIISFQQIKATEINLESNSGNIKSHQLSGERLNIAARSGNIKATNLNGAGIFKAESGNISLAFLNLSSDLTVTTKSGHIELVMPDKISYKFKTAVTAGRVLLPNQAILTHHSIQHQVGQVGTEPKFAVTAHTTSGRIKFS